ncbi:MULTISPECIES: MarR family winged helix-turn-helix transcriptional regulator [Cohnella]|uniref:MarR family winged helix-turn-helix transcriptional regulator n=1 Tax=Cohnella TaxID=329857 RepID=UPI0009BBD76A|nr:MULTISPECIES: MarR family transcriptional regulator [Cohnella]MBN2983555.1 MarR family transcriptional regulator [Cohnella algarum]
MEDELQISKLFKSFREVNQVFHQAIWRAAEGMGVTPIQFHALKTLKKHPRISLTELAELIHIGNSATSGIVDRLVKAGMVARERPETDRRTVALNVTPKGEELLRKANDSAMLGMSSLTELPEGDIDQLLRIHRAIVEKLQNVERGNEQ